MDHPADWTGLLSGLWRQFILLFILAAGVALVSAFLTTALYTRVRLISETLRQAERELCRPSAIRQPRRSRRQLGPDRPFGDEAAQECRRFRRRCSVWRSPRAPRPRSKTPLNALAISFGSTADKKQPVTMAAAINPSAPSLRSTPAIRQVDRLVRDFTDYSAPVTMERSRSMSPKF